MVLWLQPCTDTEKPTAYCELVICWLTLFSPIHSMGHGNLLRACGFSNRSLPQNDPLNCWVSFHLSQPKTCSQGIKNLYTLMHKTISKEWNPCLPLSQPYTTFIFNEQDRKVESPLCYPAKNPFGLSQYMECFYIKILCLLSFILSQ